MSACTRLLNVLSIAVIILAILRLIYTTLLNGTTEAFDGSDTNQLIIATAKWCPHCVNAMPEFNKIAAASPISVAGGTSTIVKLLDEKTNKKEIDALSIKGFPTVVYIDNSGKRSEYNGPRTYDGIMNFVNQLSASTSLTA